MPIAFANPIGFLALLGVPVILLIHLLQRQSQTFPISTLFMLDAIDRQSLHGRKLDRLRNSIPLWLQLLSVLTLTWLLIQPRWTQENQVQQIVIVIDSSASMEAFKNKATEQLKIELSRIPAQITNEVYTLIESHEQGERLYRGESITGLVESLVEWDPANSAHSPEVALRVGRSIAGANGTLIFLTDHIKTQLPFGASLLSIGEPISNVGFAGLRIQSAEDGGNNLSWQATVRNYSAKPQAREWFLAIGQQTTEPRSISLQGYETRTLSGKFPESEAKATLIMSPDAFTRDDRLFMVTPEPKPVFIATSVGPSASDMARTIIGSLENAPLLQPSGESGYSSPPDLLIATYNPLQPHTLPPASIVLLDQQFAPKEFFKGPIVAANHSLVKDLNWQGLIAKSTASIPMAAEDVTLLWQGERPLVLLRQTAELNQLIFNFDVGQSNAERLPALIIMVDRFVDQIRSKKVALEKSNLELNQRIKLAVNIGEEADDIVSSVMGTQQTVPWNRSGMLRAPRKAGFFSISQGNAPLLDAAANFADTREADFSKAAHQSDLNAIPREIIEKQTVTDPLWQCLAIMLLIVLLLCWYVLNKLPDGSVTSQPAN
jgi:hypothetical protein